MVAIRGVQFVQLAMSSNVKPPEKLSRNKVRFGTGVGTLNVMKYSMVELWDRSSLAQILSGNGVWLSLQHLHQVEVIGGSVR